MHLPAGQNVAPVLPQNLLEVFQHCANMVLRGFEGPPANAQAPWEKVKRMQAASFFHLLKLLLLATHTDRVEDLFQMVGDPATKSVDKGIARKLRRGLHVPRPSTIRLIISRLEAMLDGPLGFDPAADCYQLLWISLVIEHPIGNFAEQFLASHDWMDMESSFHLVRCLEGRGPFRSFPESFSASVSRASIPRLAGLVIALRRAAELNRPSELVNLADGLLRTLAVLGPELHRRGIAHSLFAFCAQHIFPLAMMTVNPTQLVRCSALLNMIGMAHLQTVGCSKVDWVSRSEVMNQILKGSYGADVKNVCDPSETKLAEQSWCTLMQTTGALEALKSLGLAPRMSEWVFSAKPKTTKRRTWMDI